MIVGGDGKQWNGKPKQNAEPNGKVTSDETVFQSSLEVLCQILFIVRLLKGPGIMRARPTGSATMRRAAY